MKICICFLFVVPLQHNFFTVMARKINYIDPVDSVQGLIGSKQDLRYAANNNKGYYSPSGKVNAARNYQTRIIGMVKTLSGKKYYAVRKKSSFNANANTKRACALMAGARLCVKAIQQDLNLISQLQEYAQRNNVLAQWNTLYRWLFHECYERLKLYQEEWYLKDSVQNLHFFSNPWCADPYYPRANIIGVKNIIKFWSYLCKDGHVAYVSNSPFVMMNNDTWDDLIQSSYYNFLGFTSSELYGYDCVKVSNLWVMAATDVAVRDDSAIIPARNYELQSALPPEQ